MGLTLDSAVPSEVIERVSTEIRSGPTHFIVLPD
jgi:hypothetical protein